MAIFGSSCELYADLSNRVMRTLQELVPDLEMYSIDDCWADLMGSRMFGDRVYRLEAPR
ncbi:hypothetical protein I5L56_12960 [Pseudomonas oryzihabitans]|nr:hypothetical protein [Pseudomonas oryzihabitans]MBH3330536.1 hypothetical protein [Pseudomonas oryzihabitans]